MAAIPDGPIWCEGCGEWLANRVRYAWHRPGCVRLRPLVEDRIRLEELARRQGSQGPAGDGAARLDTAAGPAMSARRR